MINFLESFTYADCKIKKHFQRSVVVMTTEFIQSRTPSITASAPDDGDQLKARFVIRSMVHDEISHKSSVIGKWQFMPDENPAEPRDPI